MTSNPGEKIRLLREASGLTIEDLAKKSGVTMGYIAKLEKWLPTHRNPTYNTMIQLAQALGVEIHEIVDIATEVAKEGKRQANNINKFEERWVLRNFRDLSDDDKIIVKSLLESLSNKK